jgi:anti-sigma factor RsiW
MTCSEAEKRLPGYLDGAMQGGDHARVREHLNSCEQCLRQVERYRLLSTYLANVEPVQPPPELAVRIRVRASQGRTLWGRAGRSWSRGLLAFENVVGPLAVPATGGLFTALAVFVLVVQNVLVGVPLSGFVANDLPLDLVQPARLESLAPFPVPGVVAAAGQHDSGALLLQATLNDHGEVVFYEILSGPTDTVVRRQIDQVLLFSRFRPQLSFGLPMNGGRVLLSFSEVRVRG